MKVRLRPNIDEIEFLKCTFGEHHIKEHLNTFCIQEMKNSDLDASISEDGKYLTVTVLKKNRNPISFEYENENRDIWKIQYN